MGLEVKSSDTLFVKFASSYQAKKALYYLTYEKKDCSFKYDLLGN